MLEDKKYVGIMDAILFSIVFVMVSLFARIFFWNNGVAWYCVAMLADVSLQDVQQVMGKAKGSWSKIMETLDYYGIQYAPKMVYPRGKDICMPKCCIAYIDGGFKLWYGGRYYGSEVAEQPKVVSYLEIAMHKTE